MKKTAPIKIMSVDGGTFRGAVLDDIVIPDGIVAKLVWNDGKPKRTLSQNAIYWLFNDFVRSYLKDADPGITAEDVHELFKGRHLPKIRTMFVNGKSIPYKSSGSTRKLSKGEFSNYFNDCIEDAGSTFGVPVELFQARYEEYKKYWSK